MKNFKVLAIETSCDDTSVAIIDSEKNILSSIVQSQYAVHQKFNGIVPELASRHHLENINFIIKEAFDKSKLNYKDIDAIAVTNTPGLSGSLLIGSMTAKTMAFILNKPLIPINHLKAHIWANLLKYNNETTVFSVDFPAIVLLVSGGHTDLYLMKSLKDEDITIIGRTRDDAVGEAFDKVAKMLDLGYPGGPIIDKISTEVDGTINFPKPNMQKTNDFSFSGLKTAVLYYFQKRKNPSLEDKYLIASSFQKVAISVLIKKLKKVAIQYNAQTIMLSGGVAANSQLRKDFEKIGIELNIKYHFPPKQFCTDNAAMVGSLAIDMIKTHGFKFFLQEEQTNINYAIIKP